jgi:hypothetical protein
MKLFSYTDPSSQLKLAAAGNVDLSQAYGNDRRTQSGKFTLAQLRATEGAIFLGCKEKLKKYF